MNDHPWKKFNPLWPSPFGANFEFPAAPAVDEPGAQPLTYAFYPPSPPPAPSWNAALTYLADHAAPIFPEPRGASPNVGRGGFLGNLAQAAEHFDPAKHRGAAPAPARASRRPPARGIYSSPPSAPGWSSVPTDPADHSTQAFPEPQSDAPWSPSTSTRGRKRGTSYGGGTESVPEILSDVTPDNHWIPGADYAADGHHEFPQAHYKSMPLETRKVFNAAKTGRLYVDSIDGRRHVFDVFHRQYNQATGELLERFMKESNIARRPELITPDHARAVLKAIAESEDPRIRLYNDFIRRFRTFYRLRGGDQ